MSSSDLEQFSNASPKHLARALQVLSEFLEKGHTELKIPIFHDYVVHGYLNTTLQEVLLLVEGVVRSEWVTMARVKWLELALDRWDIWLRTQTSLDINFRPHQDYRPLHTLGGKEIASFLKTQYVGSRRNRLIDRYLDLLQRMRELGADNGDIRKLMTGAISSRVHCDRPDDPHRDETLRDLLRKKYNLK